MLDREWLRLGYSAVVRFVVSLFLIGFVTLCLLRLAPGYGMDERELDSRFNRESVDAFRRRADRRNVFSSYAEFLNNAARGDFGFSMSLNRPVSELVYERYQTTARILCVGLVLGWAIAFVWASMAGWLDHPAMRWTGTIASALILCVPSALLAYLCYVWRAPSFLIVGMVIFARIFRVVDALFRAARTKPAILAARACGISEFRIFLTHIVPATSAEIVALAGASVSMAFGATIAAEALFSEPGLGQLVWKAALARDLSLLLSLTLLISAVTLLSNRTADAYVQARRRVG